MSSTVGKMEESTSGHNVGVLGALVATVKYTYLTRYAIFTFHPFSAAHLSLSTGVHLAVW